MVQTSNPNPKRRPPLSDYGKYAGMAFQMAAIIAVGTYGGVKLDQYFGLKFPVFTLVLSLLSIVGAIYVSIKDFLKKK